jgi:hypothetical protein
MTTRRIIVLAAVILCLAGFGFAQDEDLPLTNWSAPLFWNPAVHPRAEAELSGGMLAHAQGMQAESESLPSSPLPFVAIAPCRIVDTRVAVSDGFHQPNFIDDESRTFPFPSSTDCPGLPATAGAWSVNIQFRPMSQLSYLTAYPTGTTMPTVSTLTAGPAAWVGNAAIVPAGTGGAIDIYCQYAGRVVIDINGYYGPSSVVTSLNTLTGDVTLAQGSNVTITPSGNTLTIAGPVALPPVGAAGGSLSGDYPDPAIAPGAVGSSQLANSTAVRSLNGAQDAVTIQGSGGITVETSASTVTVGIPAGMLSPPELKRVALLNWWGETYSSNSDELNGPRGVAFDGTHIWVTNYGGRSVTEFNASDGSWVRTLSGDSYRLHGPQGVAFDGTNLWVANYDENSVTEIAVSDGGRVRTLGFYGFNGPYGVVFDGTHIWVTNSNVDSVTELNASTGSPVQTLFGGSYGFDEPRGVAFDGTHIWVTNFHGDSVTKLNASDGSWVETLSGGSYEFDGPEGVAFDGTNIWVANFVGSSVTRINTLDGRTHTFHSQGPCEFNYPFGVAFDGTHIWVTNYVGNSVLELDASDGRCVQTLSGGSYGFNSPRGVAFDGSNVWVANSGSNSVTEIRASDGYFLQNLHGPSYAFIGPQGVAFDGAHIWVTNYDGSCVTEFNAFDGSPVRTFSGGSYEFAGPRGLAFDGTHIWVANSGGNSVTAILVR